MPEPNTFSFNSPSGMCKSCNGLGNVYNIDIKLLIPDNSVSIYNGGISALGEFRENWIFKQLETISSKYNFKLKDPISKIPKKALDIILYGGKERFKVQSKSLGLTRDYIIDFEGVVNFIENQFFQVDSKKIKTWAKKYMKNDICEICDGKRLKKESQFFLIDNKSISQVNQMDIIDLKKWIDSLENKFDSKKIVIASEII
jgi:excinuclease ABC subunit A